MQQHSHAVNKSCFEIVKALIYKRANATQQDAKALIYAACSGRLEIVKRLLENGTYSEIKDKDGQRALDLAYKNNHHAIVTLLQAAKMFNAFAQSVSGSECATQVQGNTRRR